MLHGIVQFYYGKMNDISYLMFKINAFFPFFHFAILSTYIYSPFRRFPRVFPMFWLRTYTYNIYIRLPLERCVTEMLICQMSLLRNESHVTVTSSFLYKKKRKAYVPLFQPEIKNARLESKRDLRTNCLRV